MRIACVSGVVILLAAVAAGLPGCGTTGPDKAQIRAEMGAAAALDLLNSPADSLDPGYDAPGTDAGWGVYLVTEAGASAGDAEGAATAADGLDNDGDGTADEPGERWPERVLPDGRLGGAAWVRLTFAHDDTGGVLRFGNPGRGPAGAAVENTEAGWPVVTVTSRGVSANRERTASLRAVRPPLPVPCAALTAVGDRFIFRGTQFIVSGLEWDSSQSVLIDEPRAPGILTAGSPDSIMAGLNIQQRNNVEGLDDAPSVFHLGEPPDPAALINLYAPRADRTVDPGSPGPGPWGTLDQPGIVRVPGSLTVPDGLTGSGLLLVEGNLSVTGTFRWHGAVVVRGGVTLLSGGSGTHLFGTMMVGGTEAPVTVGNNTDLLFSGRTLDRLARFNDYDAVPEPAP